MTYKLSIERYMMRSLHMSTLESSLDSLEAHLHIAAMKLAQFPALLSRETQNISGQKCI